MKQVTVLVMTNYH